MKSLVVLLLLVIPVAAQDRLPILLVTGANNHDWEHTSRVLEEFLEATGRFDVTLTSTPKATLAREDLTGFAAIFLDYNGPRWGVPAEQAFLRAVRGGVGVVVMHASNNAFPGWEAFETLVGHCWRDGTSHGKFHPFDVDVIDRNHPITAAMPPLREHPDELYHALVHMHGAEHRVLMTARSSRESGGSGKVEPMAMVLACGDGRVFHTPLGHVWRDNEPSRASLDDPQLRLLIARGTEWAATGACTLEAADFGVPYTPSFRSRPHDPWVFRCVLDERARMIIAALDDHVWVAYDAASCGLYRVWGGGVKLQGAVFNAAHGPQPVTTGKPFATLAGAPRARLGGAPVAARYAGYSIHEGRLSLKYAFERGDGTSVEVVESPEHAKAGRAALERAFEVSGLRDGESVTLPLGLDPSRGGSWVSSGAAEVIGGDLRLAEGRSTITVDYRLSNDV